MDVPLVSVVIPTHNRSRLVVRAVESALAQEGVSLEVIVVDDASTDDTADVLGRIQDSRIRLVSHPENRGGSAARNTGISAAVGEYVAFLDSDDEWLPGKLAAQMVLLEAHPDVGVVYCGFRTVDTEMGVSIDRDIEAHRGDVYEELLGGWCPATTSMMVARRNLLLEVGMFDTGLTGFHDYDLLLRLGRETQFDLADERFVIRHEHGAAQLTTDTSARELALDAFLAKWKPEIERAHGRRAANRIGNLHRRRVIELAIFDSLRRGDRATAWRQYGSLLRQCVAARVSIAGVRLCLSPLPGLVFGRRAHQWARRVLRKRR